MMINNKSIDQFLVRKEPEAKKARDKIVVPPSSGHPPSTLPINNVLV